MPARPLRRSEAADHQLLLARALQLEPVAAAPVGVSAGGALGDQPLPAPVAGIAEVLLAVLVAMARVADRAPEGERPAQQRLARAQWQPPQIVTVEVEEVEEVEEDGDARAPRLLGVLDLHPALQPGKAGLAPGEGNDLAVGDEFPGRVRRQRLDQLRVSDERAAGAGDEPHLATALDRDRPHAVELALEDPAGVTEAALGQLRLHRLAEVRQRRIAHRPKIGALLLEGAIFRLVKGMVDRGARVGFASVTGSWPGEEDDSS